jgi:DNA-binding NarL/FixJ family response regulator
MIRVIVADDQALVRAGFRMILRAEPDIDVVAEASTGREAVAHAELLHPDVVLMDVRMPDMDGIEATRCIREARLDTKVLVLTTFDLDEVVYGALRAGASGFLLKDAPEDRLVTAVRVVADGSTIYAPVARRLVEEFAARTTRMRRSELDHPTPRELEVLRLMARGLSNGEIAGSIYVPRTQSRRTSPTS